MVTDSIAKRTYLLAFDLTDTIIFERADQGLSGKSKINGIGWETMELFAIEIGGGDGCSGH